MASSDDDWVDVPLQATAQAVPADDWEDVPVGNNEVHDVPHDDWQDVPLNAQATQAPAAPQTLTDTAKGIWSGAKNAYNYVGNELGTLASDANLSNALDLGKKAVKAAFDVTQPAFDAAQRVAGTAYAVAEDPVSRLMDYVSGEQHTSLIDAARQKQLASGDIQNPNELSFNNMFPVKLIDDIGAPGGSQLSSAFGQMLDSAGQSTGSSFLKETGDLLQYVAPAVGLATGLALFDALPGDFASFGSLTEEGQAAEKAGTLAPSLSQQVEQGQKSLASFKVLGQDVGATNFGVVGKQALDGASKLSVLLDSSWAGKQIAKISTYTAYPQINQALDQFGMAKNQIQFMKKQIFDSAGAQAEALGIDLADDDVQKVFENPNLSRVPQETKDQIEPLFTYLDGQLQATVKDAASNGIEVPIKNYNLGEDLENEGAIQERYVPRVTGQGKYEEFKNQQLILNGVKESQLASFNKFQLDTQDAVKALDDLGQKVGPQIAGKYAKFRDVLNTEAMNQKVQDAFGVKNYFSNDVVSAYAEKMGQVQQDVASKNFVSSIIDHFGKSDEDFLAKKIIANQNIEDASFAGRLLNPVDLQISALKATDMVPFSQFPADLRIKLSSLAEVAPELQGIEGMSVPRTIMDHMVEQLAPQRLQGAQLYAIQAQNLFKSLLTQNPGFYIRNWFQAFTMGQANGVTMSDLAESFAARVKDKGPWADRIDDFTSRRSGLGDFAGIGEEGLSNTEKVKALYQTNMTRADLASDSAMKQMWYQFRQMGSDAGGSWKTWLSKLKSGGYQKAVDIIRDNPVFRVASSIGHGGEEIPQFAYFNKLMDAGYDADTAMAKTNQNFLNFNNTRAATKSASLVFPFANHAIKNVEVTMKLLAASPGNALMYGPGGAFQHSIEAWGGWNPDRTGQYKDMLGNGWSNDQILMPVMPGFDDMQKHQDLLRDMLNTVYGWAGAKQGENIMLSLPSNYHALSMVDPTRLDSMSGPLIKSGIALLGTDPFTGKQLMSTDLYNGMASRISVAADQIVQGTYPKNLINLVKIGMDKLLNSWASNVANLGATPQAAKVIFGDDPATKAAQASIAKTIVKAATMWRGSYTSLDQDLLYRVVAKTNTMEAAKNHVTSMYQYGKINDKQFADYRKGFQKDADDIQRMVNVKSDYENLLKKTNAPAWQVNYTGNNAQ